MGPWDEERLSNGLYLAELEFSFVVWIKKDPYPYPCLFSQIVLSIWFILYEKPILRHDIFDSPVHLLRFYLYYLTITHCDAYILTWQTVNSDLSFLKLSIKRWSTKFNWKLTNHTKMAYYRWPGAWWLNQRNHVSEVSYSQRITGKKKYLSPTVRWKFQLGIENFWSKSAFLFAHSCILSSLKL